MPCILHCNAKKIRDTISSQVSGRAQLPGVIIYIVDHFGNHPISGGQTSIILTHPNRHSCQIYFSVYIGIFKLKDEMVNGVYTPHNIYNIEIKEILNMLRNISFAPSTKLT